MNTCVTYQSLVNMVSFTIPSAIQAQAAAQSPGLFYQGKLLSGNRPLTGTVWFNRLS